MPSSVLKVGIESMCFSSQATRIRQTANVRFKLKIFKIENEQIKQLKTILMDKKVRETTNLCVEIMNSKRLVKGKRDHVIQIRVCRLT